MADYFVRAPPTFYLDLMLRFRYDFPKMAPIYFNVKLWCCEVRSFQEIGSLNLAYRLKSM